MKKFNRIFVIVIDSLGVGEMPDSAEFDDTGVNTLVRGEFPDSESSEAGTGEHLSVKAGSSGERAGGVLCKAS